MRNYLRKLIMVLLVVLIIFLGIFALFNLFYNQTYIPPELEPTAVYLYKFPVPTPAPAWIRVKPPAGSTLHLGDSIEIDLFICTGPIEISLCKGPLRQKDDSFQGMFKYREWSVISVNGRLYRGFLLGSGSGTASEGTLTLPIYPLLLPGYHLFKIEPASSPEGQINPDPKLSYEWAYRME